MRNRKINFIKLGIFLFGITILLFNCEKSEIELIDIKAKKELKIKTVFENYQKNKSTLFARGESNQLTLDPQWETTVQDSLNFTEALLTNTETNINRDGNYTSKLFFVEVNDSIVSGIHSTFPKTTFEDGSLKDGNIYFNDFNGNFLDAYKVTNGQITHRLIPKANVEQANMFSFLYLFFQAGSLCWAEDTLEGGNMPGFELVLEGGSSNSGNNSNGSSNPNSNSYYSFLSNYGGSDPEEDETYEGNNGGNTGGGNYQNCTGGKLLNSATNQCECPEGKVEDSSGNCISNPCTGGKEYNQNTGECNCPDGQTEKEGRCVNKTPCDNIKGQINSLGYIVKKDFLDRKTNLKKESGYAQNKDGSFTELTVNPASNGHTLDLPTGTNRIGYLHTHLNNFLTGEIYTITGNPIEARPIRMLSPGDIIAFLTLLKHANATNYTTSKIYGTMISSSGTYTIRFNGNQSEIPNIKTDYTKSEKIKLNESFKATVIKYGKERGLLKFLKHKINVNGINLYKIKNSGRIRSLTLNSNEKLERGDCE